jgi:hypothetical protein
VPKLLRHYGIATCFHAGFLLCLFFDPEDGGDMFLRNAGWLSTDYTALYPRRYNCSLKSSWKCLWVITWIFILYGRFSMSQVCLLHLAFRELITLPSSSDWLSLYRRLLFLSLVMATVTVEPWTFWTPGYALGCNIPFRLPISLFQKWFDYLPVLCLLVLNYFIG